MLVAHFLDKSLGLLKESGVELNHVVVFSDRASLQYKNRGPMADLSDTRKHISMERGYFGSDTMNRNLMQYPLIQN